MKKSDTERIKKIISLWESLKNQINEHSITADKLMTDEFLQWAVTTPLYNLRHKNSLFFKTKSLFY